MKKLLLGLFFSLVLGVSSAFAAPFLVSDPTVENVTKYEVEVNGVSYGESISQSLGDGTVRLYFDISGLVILSTNPTFRARASNGVTWSSWSAPYTYGSLSAPTNLLIIP